MYPYYMRKYLDILSEAEQAVIDQSQLANLYSQAKTLNFIKNTPVALVPFPSLEKLFGPDQAKNISALAGAVDRTSYEEAYRQKGYVVFQWNSGENKPDIYIADPNSIKSKYTKFDGQLPTDAKARSKIPSLVVLDKLGLNAEQVTFYVKKVPTEMIRVDDIQLGGKTIQTSWGTQVVQPGGYLVKEPNGHIYTVAPDGQGLPIGYIHA